MTKWFVTSGGIDRDNCHLQGLVLILIMRLGILLKNFPEIKSLASSIIIVAKMNLIIEHGMIFNL